MSADDRVAETVRLTADALGVQPEDLDYITAELLDEDSDAAETAEGVEEQDLPEGGDHASGDAAEVDAAVVPNRIWLVSHVVQGGFDGTQVIYYFYANCTYAQRWFIGSGSINRFERDGTCRTPNGSQVPRWKMYWRA